MDIFTYTVLFLIGIFFGSFFTLAVYRIPNGENILYKHSYCPKCNHKLGFLDLIPVFSYLFIRGKCRYCHEKVRIRYFLLEILSGIVFVLYGYSIKLNIIFCDINTCISLLFMSLYIVGIFIIAGIDKERKQIQNSVLWYQIFIIIAYMIYICTLDIKNAYIYVIYLAILILTILLDVILLRKSTQSNYWMKLLILLIGMLIFNGMTIMILTIVISLLSVLAYNTLKIIKQKIHKFKQKDNPKNTKLPIGFILCVSNIISVLIINILENYIF